jgi:hypothetical protein
MTEPETVAIWPLRTPPTEEDLDRIWLLSRELQRPLRESEVLYLMVPWGRA